MTEVTVRTEKKSRVGMIVLLVLMALVAIAIWLILDRAQKASNELSSNEPVATLPAGSQTALAAITDTNDLSTLEKAVSVAGLVDALKANGPITVFAPNDAAFAALGDGELDSLLLPENKTRLENILKYHVVNGKFAAKDLTEGKVLDTMAGGQLTVHKDGDKISLTDAGGNTLNVIRTNANIENGIVYVVDKVAMPL